MKFETFFPVSMFILVPFLAFCIFMIGYKWPRDVELESTKPVVFKYEISPEAAKLLIEKSTGNWNCEK